MPDITLTDAQRRTLPGRQALAAKFSSPEEKREYYRRVGAKGNAGRMTLPADDADALRRAYELLRSIAHKFPVAEDEAEP